MAIVRWVGAAVVFAAAVFMPSASRPSFAQARVDPANVSKAPVTLAEVSSGPAETSSRLAHVGALLRHDVEAELLAINWKSAGLRRRYTLSAAIVRLDSALTGERALLASCTVSASVRDAERGTLLAIVEGRARAEDAPTAALEAERGALLGAVRGAIKALPEAIRRAEP